MCVGKLKEAYLLGAEREYVKRIQAYTKFQTVEVSEERNQGRPKDVSRALDAEAVRILGACASPVHICALVALDGEEMSSLRFMGFVQERLAARTPTAFVIGSSFGLAPSFLNQANTKLSLSKMTLPHQLARIVLLEQVYRALNTINGGKYHK